MKYVSSKESPVSVVEVSDNSKTGPVSATYASQKTCPNSCPLKGSGCYAESDFTGFTTRRLNANADPFAVEELAHMEASGIAGLTGKLPLRIHVVGDATTDRAAGILADAAEYHMSKHDQPVWAYTHAWRDVSRESWGKVSVLASCETSENARWAMDRGYAAAVVVKDHKADVAYDLNGVKAIPCPQQTGKAANCKSCKLCFNADRLLKTRSVIAFSVHGGGAKKASNALNILQ